MVNLGILIKETQAQGNVTISLIRFSFNYRSLNSSIIWNKGVGGCYKDRIF